MGIGALLLFYQGQFMEASASALWYPEAGMLVGEPAASCPAATTCRSACSPPPPPPCKLRQRPVAQQGYRVLQRAVAAIWLPGG